MSKRNPQRDVRSFKAVLASLDIAIAANQAADSLRIAMHRDDARAVRALLTKVIAEQQQSEKSQAA